MTKANAHAKRDVKGRRMEIGNKLGTIGSRIIVEAE
jgi:hypothetical protein